MNIPLFKVSTSEGDVEAVAQVIRRGMNWANGPEIQELENRVSEYVGTRYAVAFNSGTSALHAALIALGIGRAHKVIIPSFTFPATANVVLAVGATPVFADIEEETYGIDIDSIPVAPMTSHVAMPVHVGGCVCRDIYRIAENFGTIEDAAESLGAKSMMGNKAGTMGMMAMFSLCAPKIITTGEGGLLVTSRTDLYNRLIRIRDHGNPEREVLGYNWRMSSMTAALAISQLSRIEEMIEKRRGNALYLRSLLEILYGRLEAQGADAFRLPVEPAGSRHIYQMFTIRVRGKDRDPLLTHLWDNGIGAKVYFPPVHLMPLYKKLGWKEGDLPVTEKVSKEVITLPMYPDLTGMEMDYMAEVIGRYFKK